MKDIEHLRFTYGSFLLDPDALSRWRGKKNDGRGNGVAVRQKWTALHRSSWKYRILQFDPWNFAEYLLLVCNWIGAGKWTRRFCCLQNLSQERSVLPCCSATPCKALGFMSRKTKRANQITLNEKKKSKKKTRKHAAASTSIVLTTPSSLTASFSTSLTASSSLLDWEI